MKFYGVRGFTLKRGQEISDRKQSNDSIALCAKCVAML
jgi:hypothetical protein